MAPQHAVGGYTAADIVNFLKAHRLARQIDTSVDPDRFSHIIERHKGDSGYSHKYFNRTSYLRSKAMRALELGLDQETTSAVLDIGCGPGYFLYVCRWLGHAIQGIDLPDCGFYNEMIDLFQVPRAAFRIEPYKHLPTFERKFDIVCAHQICFNGHKTPQLWGLEEWRFLFNDLSAHHLKPTGVIALEFNREPTIGFFPDQLRRFFEDIDARVYRGRVFVHSADVW